MRKIQCAICGCVYDEAAGFPKIGITPGTKWEDVPSDFVCPICSASKSAFREMEEDIPEPVSVSKVNDTHFESLKELSASEISVVCSSLAKGCEKQRLLTEMEAFNSIADYFKTVDNIEIDKTFRCRTEDILRESGYMLPQSAEVRELLESILAKSFPVYLKDKVELLLNKLQKS